MIGLTASGDIKTWVLDGSEGRSEVIYERSSSTIDCPNSLKLSSCLFDNKTLLVVCYKYWRVSLRIWVAFRGSVLNFDPLSLSLSLDLRFKRLYPAVQYGEQEKRAMVRRFVHIDRQDHRLVRPRKGLSL